MSDVRPLPHRTIPPPAPASESAFDPDERDSSVDLPAAPHDLVALAVDEADGFARALREASVGWVLAGPESIPMATAVLVDAGSRAGLRERIAHVRRVARSDVAVLVVVRSAEEASTAYAAGAFACVRRPLVAEEIAGLLASALDSRAAKVHAADLEHKLDLEAHLASIGRISAGLTHELANPVAAAGVNLEALRNEFARPGVIADAKVRAAIEAELSDLASSLERVKTLLAGLRPLQREPLTELVEVDLAEIVLSVLRWAEEPLRGVDVEQVVAPLRARAEPMLLGQVLVNLATNAAHAAKTLPTPRVRFHVYSAGRRVVVSVRDNGPGIAEDLQDKIFEPFFTTRRGHGGVGLGLALCREYARRMDATLSLWSAPGRGTCFRLALHGV